MLIRIIKSTFIVLVSVALLAIIGCNNDNGSKATIDSSPDNDDDEDEVDEGFITEALQVLGQYVFETNTSATTVGGLNQPSGTAYDSTNKRLFVVDGSNNRVLVYSAASVADGDVAVGVLGQTGFTTSTSGTTASTLSSPYDVAYDSLRNYLYVSDSANNRILVYDVATITNGEAAIKVLGQTTFVAAGSGTTSIALNGPKGLTYNSTTKFLFAVDQSNNRVLAYNLTTIVDGEAAVKVLGQPDYVTATSGSTSATLDTPTDAAADAENERLFVADTGNNRVLVYSTAAISNGDAAVNVLGQTNFTANTAGTTAITMDAPSSLTYDGVGQRLFVGDYDNHRVLVFNVASVTNQEAAARVLGQSLFTTATSGTTSIKLTQPLGMSFDSVTNRLFLADRGNHRVLIFDTYVISTGEAAVHELGQQYFSAKTASATARGLSGAKSMSLDTENRRLFVADSSNNRVLIYDTDVTTSGAEALNVLGQSSLTGSAAGTTSTTLSAPASVLYDAENDVLYVADTGNNRVLVYDTSFVSDGDAAIYVLGQANFTTGTSGSTAATLDSPTGLALDSAGDRLFVVDSGNHRVLVYDVAAITNGESAVNVFGQANFTANSSGSTASTLDTPMTVNYDAVADRIFVSDSGNNRVLVYSVASITDGEAAVNVIGQTNFTGSTTGTTATTLNGPTGVFYESTHSRLFVSDGGNHRVLIYEGMGGDDISDAPTAGTVIGQTDLVTGTSGITAATLNGPQGLHYDLENKRLYIADASNNRIIIWAVE